MPISTTRMQGVAAREEHLQTAGNANVANAQAPAARSPLDSGARQRSGSRRQGNARLVFHEQAQLEHQRDQFEQQQKNDRDAKIRALAQDALTKRNVDLTERDMTHRQTLQDAAEKRAQELHAENVRRGALGNEQTAAQIEATRGSEGRAQGREPILTEGAQLDNQGKRFNLEEGKKDSAFKEEARPLEIRGKELDNAGKAIAARGQQMEQGRREEMFPIQKEGAQVGVAGAKFNLEAGKAAEGRAAEMFPIQKEGAQLGVEGQKTGNEGAKFNLEEGKKDAARKQEMIDAYGPTGQPPSVKDGNSYIAEATSRGIDPSEIHGEDGKMTVRGAALMEAIDRLKLKYPKKSESDILDAAIKSSGVRTQDLVLKDEYETLKAENVKEMGYGAPRTLRNESPKFHERYKRMQEIETKIKAIKSAKAAGANKPSGVSYGQQVEDEVKKAKSPVTPEVAAAARQAAKELDDAIASGDVVAKSEANRRLKEARAAMNNTGN